MIRNGLKSFMVGVVVAMFMAGGLAYAQIAPPPGEAVEPKTIFDFKAELKLTTKQSNEIKAILYDLNRDLRSSRRKLTSVIAERRGLVNNEADMRLIRKKVQEESKLRENIVIKDIVATRRINRVLSPKQLARWREIQASARAARTQ